MRAVTVNEYGAEPALMEVRDPQPGPEQALIKVEAAGVNPMDRVIADGGLKEMMPASFPLILGADLTGVIEAGGDKASNFSPGEEAFGQLMIAPLGSTCVADTEALAAGGVSGVNFKLEASSGLLERLADAVVSGRIVVPPITRIELEDVPVLSRNGHADGKTVITL